MSYDYLFKIIFVGDTNVGKTALAELITKNDFTHHYDATIGVDFSTITLDIDEKKGTFINKDIKSKVYFRDTNFAAYIATACWHDFLINNSVDILTNNWEMIEKAINFVIENQMDDGSIRWAAKSLEAPKDDSLLTGCCSIYKSLICAINCASQLNKEKIIGISH